MKKIAVISMVRNEADIIESFVRHTLSFADVLLVVDHQSTDGTADILRSLQQEGCALQVQKFTAMEQAQSLVMTRLLYQAIAEEADIILPLDADEFLLCDTPEPKESQGQACRGRLQQFAADLVYALDWVRYLPRNFLPGKFILAADCQREREPDALKKIAVGREAAIRTHLSISQGNHAALIQEASAVQRIVPEPAPGLHIAHFPWRSENQAQRKAAVGWLANVANYSRYTGIANHWQREFLQLQRGERLQVQPLQHPVNAAAVPGIEKIQLRHTAEPESLVQSLLRLGEAMAESYAELKVQQQRKKVSVLLPFWGDLGPFQKSLESAVATSYPYCEYIVFTQQTVLPDAFYSLLEAQPVQQIQLLQEAEQEKLFAMLAATADGDYIQWLFPGDQLHADKIGKMVTALETQKNLTFLVSGAAGNEKWEKWNLVTSLQMGEEIFLPGEGAVLYPYLLAHGQGLANGISAVLFRQQTMDELGWLQDCFIDERPLWLAMWIRILRGVVLGGMAEVLTQLSEEPLSAEDVLWQQLQWFYLLQEERTENVDFVPHSYQQAVQNFLQQKERLRPLLSQAAVQIVEQYEQICQQLQSELHG